MIDEIYKEAREMVAWMDGFHYLILKQIPVYLSNDIQVAATDGKAIFVGREFGKCDVKMRAMILMHEVQHIILKHVERMEGRDAATWNLATDSVINSRLNKMFGAKLPVYIAVEQSESSEEVYDRAIKAKKECGASKNGIESRSGERGESDLITEKRGAEMRSRATKIQEGKELGEEEKEKMIAEAMVMARKAGLGAGSLIKELEGLLRQQVDWRRVLRGLIESELKKTVVQSWMKVNRRNGDLPGVKVYAKPRVFVAVDVSGSVWNIVKVFFSELDAIARNASEIILIQWDDGIRDVRRIRGTRDIEKVVGGGGTRFIEVAKMLRDKAKTNDVVVVMTDGFWSDDERIVEEINKIMARKILVTTNNVIGGFDVVLKIKGD